MATNKYIIQLVVETGTGQAKVLGVSKAFEQLETSAKKVTPALKKAKEATDGMGGAAGIAGATAAEFGRLISDLPFGLQAVTNNISQLGSMFALLVSSSGGVIKGLKNLGTVMLGPAGVLIAFQAVVAAVEFFSRGTRNAEKAVNDLNKALEQQRKLIKDITLTTNDELGKTIRLLTEYSTEFKELFEGMLESGRSTRKDVALLTTEYGELLNVRRQIEIKEKALSLLREDDQKNRIRLEGQINGLRLQELDLLTKLQDTYGQIESADFAGDSFFDETIEVSDELIAKLVEVRKQIEDPIVGFFDLNNLEDDVLQEVNALLKPIEDARRAALDALLDTDDPVLFYENELAELQAFLSDKQKLEELDFEQYKRLKLEEKSLSDFVRESKFRNSMIEIDLRQQITDSVSNSLGTLSSLFGEATAQGRMFALAQIAFDTATGFTQGLDIAQKSSKALGPLSAFAFPVFYASQVASVLSAVGRAKQVLNASAAATGGGGGLSTPSAPSAAPPLSTLPSFNVVGSSTSQLAQILGAQGQQPVKAYVVAGEVSSAQSLERNRVKEASI